MYMPVCLENVATDIENGKEQVLWLFLDGEKKEKGWNADGGKWVTDNLAIGSPTETPIKKASRGLTQAQV